MFAGKSTSPAWYSAYSMPMSPLSNGRITVRFFLSEFSSGTINDATRQMHIDMTLGNLAGFLMLAYVATIFMGGYRLLRFISWAFLWQLLTPPQEIHIDMPMLLAGFLALEWSFSKLQ